jgi:hypothetical protein
VRRLRNLHAPKQIGQVLRFTNHVYDVALQDEKNQIMTTNVWLTQVGH